MLSQQLLSFRSLGKGVALFTRLPDVNFDFAKLFPNVLAYRPAPVGTIRHSDGIVSLYDFFNIWQGV
jgi:hypothetical protein